MTVIEPMNNQNGIIASKIVSDVEVMRFDETSYLTVEDLKIRIKAELDDKDLRVASLLEAAKEMLEKIEDECSPGTELIAPWVKVIAQADKEFKRNK